MVKIIKTKAKSIFTKTGIPSVDFVINQYVGCEHACAYCYAKFMCRWKSKSYGKWGEWVEVKMNAPELAKKFVKGLVAMSSVSDAYQPVERELKITRRILENMDKRTELHILTKSDLVLRDIDLFKKLRKINVGLTINAFVGREKELFEPNSPNNKARLRALKILKENNIKTYGFISPVIPGLIEIDELITESRDFVNHYIVEIINIGVAGHEFKKILRENYPKSYEIASDKNKFQKFLEHTKQILKKSGVNVLQFVAHYPKFERVILE